LQPLPSGVSGGGGGGGGGICYGCCYSGPAAEAGAAVAARLGRQTSRLPGVALSCPKGVETAEWLSDVAVAGARQALARPGGGAAGGTGVGMGVGMGVGGSSPHAASSAGRSRSRAPPFAARGRASPVLPWPQELWLLLRRGAVYNTRHPMLLRLQLGASVFAAAIVCAMTRSLKSNLAGLQNRSGAIFFTLAFCAFAALSSLDALLQERKVLEREGGVGVHRVWTYFCSKAALDALTMRVLPSAVFSAVVYPVLGLRPQLDKFAVFTATLMLFSTACSAMVLCVVAVSPTAGVCNTVSTLLLLLWLLLGGFLVNIRDLADAPAVNWMQYSSPFRYAFETLVSSEMEGMDFLFDPPGMAPVAIQAEMFLETLGMRYANAGRNTLALVAMVGGAWLLGFVLLWLRLRCPALCRCGGVSGALDRAGGVCTALKAWQPLGGALSRRPAARERGRGRGPSAEENDWRRGLLVRNNAAPSSEI
jgi:ABC-type multidrug transport system permease subunit